MTPKEAIELVSGKFPFEGYMTRDGKKGEYLNIANTVLRHLSPRSKILDFGCGPCDKTAILQTMGFECSGYDDLQDIWHVMPGNRERILSFTKETGIDLRLADGGQLPFEKGVFDMIMSHDVLEHLHNSPRDLVNDLLELATPAGLLFLTIPNAVNVRKRIAVLFGKTNLPRFESYYWYPGSWRGHVREYVRDDLVKLAEYLNLDILELRACDHMLQRLPVSIRSTYLLVTSVFQDWKDAWLLVARKRPGWMPIKNSSNEELARFLGSDLS